jgi:serine-type D-Ala-D-Ala carboxypeptidase/endopeptidase (penicillin-binding protein 4)
MGNAGMMKFDYQPRLRLAGCLLLSALLASSAVAGVDAQAQAMVRAADLRTTKVAIYAEDLQTGQPLISLNADEPMIPASNMKLVTTAAALDTLGPGFVFKTELRWADEGVTARAAKPTADTTAVPAAASGATLVIRGDGDPGLGDPELLALANKDIEDLLQSWVAAVKAAKITRVRRLLVDDRVFDQEFTHPTWPEAQLSNWYCAQVAGLSFNDNCLDIFPEPTRAGQSPIVRIRPTANFLSTTNKAVTITDASQDNFWVVRKPGTNDLTFWGKVKSRRTQPLAVTMHDPPIFFTQVLSNRLIEAGIPVEACGRISPDEQLPPGRVLHTIKTELPAVIARCNKDSQNLFAECLMKRLGFAKTGAPGSWENGAAAIRLMLANRLGPTAAVVNIADGSGMSRDNRVTPRVLVRLLDAMHQDPKTSDIYRTSLSEAGRDGTLKDRLENIDGKVYGKTGFINGVSTMSGYLVVGAPKGNQPVAVGNAPASKTRVVAFSFLFNNFPPQVSVKDLKSLQDRMVKLLEKDYESFAPAPADSVRQGG